MRDFKRGLRDEAWRALERLAELPNENWWKELLRRWTPSGHGEGLRIAVRVNTLDFYHHGHCVAHISFGRCKKGQAAPARVKCHVKYVFEDENLDQDLATLNAETSEWEWGRRIQKKSLADIILYIDRRKKRWTEGRNKTKLPEKVGVDAIVSNNANVIDLEMGLPAWREKRSALRMDVVALERKPDGIYVVFWEAKTFDDDRLYRLKTPNVISQLVDDYGDYLKSRQRGGAVELAYRNACEALKRIDAMGIRKPPLAPLVIEAASAPKLEIDPRGRLIVFGYTEAKAAYWKKHRLRLDAAGIPILISANASDIRLPTK